MKKTRSPKRVARARSGSRRSVTKAPRRKSVPRAKTSRQPNVRQLARSWFERLWNDRDASVLVELMHPTATGDTEGGTVTGHDEFFQKLHTPLLGAFPDLRVSVEGVIADGNDVAVRWRLNATHAGDTLGIPATNRRVSITGMTWLQFKNGKVINGWDRWNAGGLTAYLTNGTECHTVRLPA